MDTLADTLWDVIICGTGLQQSLLALSLSHSGKNILHVDPNPYYGGHEAALSLQEAEECTWLRNVAVEKTDGAGLVPRSYALALAPQITHARSRLVGALVSSRVHRQIEFLAVGRLFVLQAGGALVRIPSTREDVFSSTALSPKEKRLLMKVLKLALASAEQDVSDVPLSEFLVREFGLSDALSDYILAMALSIDGRVSAKEGLATIKRHITSMGVFGLGFAAVYPKWGGMSEVAQAACRACAVGGGVYMLGTVVEEVGQAGEELDVVLRKGDETSTVKAKVLVGCDEEEKEDSEDETVARLVAVMSSPLLSLFEPVVDGALTPAVAVVALPSGVVKVEGEQANEFPVYVLAHSSDTGECPAGQSVLYLTTKSTAHARSLLTRALDLFISAVGEFTRPRALFQLYYELRKHQCPPPVKPTGPVINFPATPVSLAFDDAMLERVRDVWRSVVGETEDDEGYMKFADRDELEDQDDIC